MHYLYHVKVSKEEAKTSAEAREAAVDALTSNGFVQSEGGYFSGGRADWLVVGGRWSGVLQTIQLATDFHEEIKKLLGGKEFMSTKDVEDKAVEIQALWERLGGNGDNPYARDNYDSDGAKDDAMKLTPQLLAAIKKRYPIADQMKEAGMQDWKKEGVYIFDAVECDEYQIGRLDEQSLGDWIVVIDYHN